MFNVEYFNWNIFCNPENWTQHLWKIKNQSMPLGYHSKLKLEGVPSVSKLVLDYQSLEIFNYFDKESLFMNWRYVQYQAGLGIGVQSWFLADMKQVYGSYWDWSGLHEADTTSCPYQAGTGKEVGWIRQREERELF